MLSSKAGSAFSTITITAHSFLAHIHADLGDLDVRLLQMPLSIQTSLDIFPPPTHYSLSLYHHHIQGGHLLSICQLSHPFLDLLLLKNNEACVMEASSALYFLDHHTATQIVAKLCVAAPSLQKPMIRFITT